MDLNITFENTTIKNPEGKDLPAVLIQSHGLELCRILGPGACGAYLLQVPDLNGEYTRPAVANFHSLDEAKGHIAGQLRQLAAGLLIRFSTPVVKVRRGDPVWVLMADAAWEAVVSRVNRRSAYVLFAPSGGGTHAPLTTLYPKADTAATQQCRQTFDIAPKWKETVV